MLRSRSWLCPVVGLGAFLEVRSSSLIEVEFKGDRSEAGGGMGADEYMIWASLCYALDVRADVNNIALIRSGS